MAEATNTPSPATRRLIRRARRRGLFARASLTGFTEQTRQAVRAFDAEVDPLHLSDEDYDRAVRSSGLERVLTAASHMHDALTALFEPSA